MQKVLKKICFPIIAFILFSSGALAIECEYPEAGITITYDSDNVIVNSDEFKDDYFTTLPIVAKWGSNKYSTEELKIDQTLFEKYEGYACPTNMKVCKYANYNISLPSIKSLIYDIHELVVLLGNLVGLADGDDLDDASKKAWALLELGERELHILTESEYKNSEIKKYEGGVLYAEALDAYDEGYEACEFNDEWYADITGFACGVLWGTANGVVWDTLIEDGVELIYYKVTTCDTVQYQGEYASFDINCGLLQTKLYKYRNQIDVYKDCGDDSNCQASENTNLLKIEDEIKTQCSSILKNYDYVDTQKGCIQSCLKIKNTLNEMKEGTNLYEVIEENQNDCNISSNLITWIKNILKWIKYILPVLVIILGIIDFIKAIASDSDDEMKKAQGRFIKRLIAAALLFLVPALIEFIFEIFKIGDNPFCGLID